MWRVVRRGATLLFLASLAGAALFPSRLAAQARAACVLVAMLDPPVLAPALRAVTREPRVEDHHMAGVPTLSAYPSGEGPWPAILFANGATPEGRHHPVVVRLAAGMARAGFVVHVPELPGFQQGEVVPESVGAAVGVAAAATEESRGGRVGLVGVSTGGSIALLAAQDPRLARRVSVVSGVAPYTNIENVFRIATTGTHREGGRTRRYVPAEGYLALVAARSLARVLPASRDRDRMSVVLRAVPDTEPDPLAVLASLDGEITDTGARAVLALLSNREPERFDDLWAELPRPTRERLATVSPIEGAEQISAPVELVTAPRDKYFPVQELTSVRLSTRQRVTVTGALQHGDPAASLGKLGDLARLDAFVVRSLGHARAP